jgi:hypothetical protein
MSVDAEDHMLVIARSLMYSPLGWFCRFRVSGCDQAKQDPPATGLPLQSVQPICVPSCWVQLGGVPQLAPAHGPVHVTGQQAEARHALVLLTGGSPGQLEMQVRAQPDGTLEFFSQGKHWK